MTILTHRIPPSLYDFVTFPNGAFSGTVISTVLKLTSLREIAEYQLLLGTISLPGAIIGAFLVKRIGTRLQLVLGFSGYLILGLIIGLAWTHIIKIPALFVVFYGLFTSSKCRWNGGCDGAACTQ